MQKNSLIDNSLYDALGDRWYTAYNDPVAVLRAESKTKFPWVLERIQKHFPKLSEVKHLDVGCGAGFLSNPLAQEGIQVTGLDLSAESLSVAARHDLTQSVKYISGDAYHLPFPDQSFDVVSAMDFLEHVEDPARAIREMSRVLKPGGLFFFHTFNRNWLADLIVIRLLEFLVQNTPPNMHVIELFIKPKELKSYCSQSQMDVREMTGIRPIFSTITLKAITSGVVPEKFAFKLTPSLKLSYMGYAIKQK